MDWRDAATGVSTLISLGALGVAGYALRLTWARDRRDVEAKTPAIDITLPPCLGAGPWTAACEIANRSAETLVLEAIQADATGLLVVTSASTDYATGRHEQRGRRALTLSGRRIDRVIRPGEVIAESVVIALSGGLRQLPGPTPIKFYVDLRARNARQSMSRRIIARTATI